MTRVAGSDAFWAADTQVPLLRESIGEVLRDRAAQSGARAALLWPADDDVETMSYAELLVAAEGVARSLLVTSRPGDRVAVWSSNSVEWVILEYACALAGLVLTPFNTAWTDYEIEHALALTEPCLVFAGSDGRGGRLVERAQRLAPPASVIDLATLPDLPPAAEKALPPISADAPFLIQFTSGTTGRAKGALLSHRAALNAVHLRSCAGGDVNDHDVWLNAIPLHHMGGSISLVLGALVATGGYVVMERFDPDRTVRLLGPTGATRTGGVPTMLLAVLDHPDLGKDDVHIRAVSLGGASVPSSLVRRIQRDLGAVVAVIFGQSECPIVTTTNDTDDPETIATSVGRPVAQSDVKIVDPDTRDLLAIDVVGEVCVRSPIVMEGYYAMPDATSEVIDGEGFLHTGDLGSMDANGIITIRGRAREMIIRGGENIYPIEVESALLQHPAVANAAVLGIPDDKYGEQVGAAVCLAPGSTATPAELEAFVGERIAHFKVPRTWRFVDTFPLTASGKIRKVELADLW